MAVIKDPPVHKHVAFWELGVWLLNLLQDHKCVPHMAVHKNGPGGWSGLQPAPDTPPPGTKSSPASLGRKPGSVGPPCVYVCVCKVFLFVFKFNLSRPFPSSSVTPKIAATPCFFLPLLYANASFAHALHQILLTAPSCRRSPRSLVVRAT